MAALRPTARGVAAAIAVAFIATTAFAHRSPYHKTVQLVVRADGIAGVVTLDMPRGAQALQTRASADLNADKVLDGDERQALKAPLARLAMRSLEVKRGGTVCESQADDARIDLHGSTAVDDKPLSIAVMASFNGGDGRRVEVRDEAPDGKPVHVRVSFEAHEAPPVEAMATRRVPVVAPKEP